jgi:hypothetical protein
MLKTLLILVLIIAGCVITGDAAWFLQHGGQGFVFFLHILVAGFCWLFAGDILFGGKNSWV